nr:HEAT repeat domain-containing protein [Cyclobacteriaceae bacterium]
MKAKLLRFLDVEHGEAGRVALLFVMGFFMGMFLATISVASQSLFLEHFDETTDLPLALLISGAFGLGATIIYNFLQNRIPFPLLASLSLMVIFGLTAFIEYGEGFFEDPNTLFFFGFTQIVPFSFIIYLVFWGAFGRLFNLRQAKRLVGTVDVGAMIASFLAFFSIPQILKSEYISTENLYSISLVSIFFFLLSYLYLSFRYLNKTLTFQQERTMYKKLRFGDFIQNRYILYMSLFVIVSMMAINFVDYSFLNVTTLFYQNDTIKLASFIASFEGTVVIFSILFETFATDRIIHQYGMRVPLLINPILIGLFTIAALALGYIFGYTPQDNLFVVFFLIIALSKLLIGSLKDALDNPTFKLYLLPIESNIRIDVQTKIEGLITALASFIAGGLIILINQVKVFDLISITIFTLPLLAIWYFVANRMNSSYLHTLQDTLLRNKQKTTEQNEKEFTLNRILEKEINSGTEEKVIYGLKLMEKLEPALFENAVIRLSESENKKIKLFAETKIQALGVEKSEEKTIRSLARQAASDVEDSDQLSISPDNLMRLSKSVKQNDRLLAAKLLRKLTSTKTIFILLELLRDVDPKVRMEALLTARKVKRAETWPVLIEMLASPTYGHQAAAALKEAGESVLPTLEAAFHKSGQLDMVMLRIVQIMGRIGGKYALQLLWRKADYPDKRIVKQILFSLRYINYRAQGREVREVITVLETEISKAIWNLAAIHELRDNQHFKYLQEALREEVAENYDQITILLSIVYDPQSVQLVRENIESGDPDNIAFAMELMDIFIDQELKPKLFPLFDDSPTEEKLRQLQIYFPRENYTPIQVINYILNRDYNLNNRWTKACALHACAYLSDFRVSRGLAAHMFNKDKLLQETASWVIYNKDPKAYEALHSRLPQRDKNFIDASIENNQLLDGLEDGFYLGIEMIMFLKQVPVFHHIHGSLLSDLADKITPIELSFSEKFNFNYEDQNSPIFIVAHGGVQLWNDDLLIDQLKKGSIYGDLFQDGPPIRANKLTATERSIVFKINLMDFYLVMANHHELVQGLIKNITGQIKPQHSPSTP